MISVQEASAIVQAHVRDFGTIEVDIDEAIGHVLREALVADRDFPPYHRITMDGIAIKEEAFANGQRQFPIKGIAPAGAPQQTLAENACIEVMTGAMLPLEADTVIRYEDLNIENEVATIQLDKIKWGQNVHKKGEDRQAGSVVVKPNTVISPAEIGVAATVGKATLKVSRRPKTIIISTGDELVSVDQTPLPYQIRRSNVHRLKATLSSFGIPADTHHLNDKREEILLHLKEILDTYDVVILSGGVSKGKFDYIPEAMEQLGVAKLFHKIKQRPGKPFWFGKSSKGNMVFALPGNPVSSFMCTQCYFVPWLKACLQLEHKPYPTAMLHTPLTFKPDLTYFAQVKIHYDDQGRLLASPVEGNGSGDLANLVDADGFLQISRGKDFFEAGECFPFIPFKPYR